MHTPVVFYKYPHQFICLLMNSSLKKVLKFYYISMLRKYIFQMCRNTVKEVINKTSDFVVTVNMSLLEDSKYSLNGKDNISSK